jgi:hypothetical protein
MLTKRDEDFIKNNPHVLTKLGVVAVLAFSSPFPRGWERLNYQEAYEHRIIEEFKKPSPKPLLKEWSIVAFQQGKMTGSGYGYKIEPSYGGECGEGFILRRGPVM